MFNFFRVPSRTPKVAPCRHEFDRWRAVGGTLRIGLLTRRCIHCDVREKLDLHAKQHAGAGG